MGITDGLPREGRFDRFDRFDTLTVNKLTAVSRCSLRVTKQDSENGTVRDLADRKAPIATSVTDFLRSMRIWLQFARARNRFGRCRAGEVSNFSIAAVPIGSALFANSGEPKSC